MRSLLVGLLLLILLASGWWWLGPAGQPVPGLPAAAAETSAPGLAEGEAAALQPAESAQAELLQQPESTRAASTPEAAPEAEAEADSDSEAGLLVRVFDHLGQPAAEVPVSLMQKSGFSEPREVSRGVTAANGIARVAYQAPSQSWGSAPSFKVAADLPACDPIEVRLERAPEPGDACRLDLPPMGSVVIEVHGPDGELHAEPAWVGTRWVPTVEVGTRTYGGYERCPDSQRFTVASRTRYPWVGPGVSLSVQAKAPGFRPGYLTDKPGPSVGEELVWQVQLGAALPVLKLQASLASGRELGEGKLLAQTWKGSGRGSDDDLDYGFDVFLGADGSGEAFYRYTPDADFERELEVTWRTAGLDAQEDPQWSRGVLPLPNRLESGRHYDLGRVRLIEARVLVEGQLLDDAGAPLPKATLRFAVQGTPRWEGLDSVRTDAEGRFVLRGFSRAPLLQISGSSKVRRRFSFDDIATGDRQVLLQLDAPVRLAPAGSLLVSFDLEEGMPRQALELLLTSPGADKVRAPLYGTLEQPMLIKRLAPGTWKAVVRFVESGTEVLEVSGLVVRAEEQLEDERLLPLDLKGRVELWSWNLGWDGDSEALPCRKLSVRIRPVGGQQEWRSKTDDAGLLRILLPLGGAGPLEVSGDRERWVPLPANGQALRLPRPRD